MGTSAGLSHSDRVRVRYDDSPDSRLQFGGVDLPYVPRLRAGIEATANGGGVVHVLPLIDTGATFPLIRAEDWSQVFDQTVQWVHSGPTTDGRATEVVKIGGGEVPIDWGFRLEVDLKGGSWLVRKSSIAWPNDHASLDATSSM